MTLEQAVKDRFAVVFDKVYVYQDIDIFALCIELPKGFIILNRWGGLTAKDVNYIYGEVLRVVKDDLIIDKVQPHLENFLEEALPDLRRAVNSFIQQRNDLLFHKELSKCINE